MTDSGSMTNPSEAMIEAGRRYIRSVGSLSALDLSALYRVMQQAATPAAPACPAGFDPCICPDAVAAPVQDDDAEFLLDLALTMNDIEAAAIRRIAARLTPDRATPLVEALHNMVALVEDNQMPLSKDEYREVQAARALLAQIKGQNP